jgi:uncharacterized protein YndB with AHSA1/START domain
MTPLTTEHATVHLQRTIAAPPADVYRAWLDPELLRRWIAGMDRTVTRAEVDPQVGGRLSIWQSDPAGADAGGMEARIVELLAGERIVFDWNFVGPEREADPALGSRLTVTFNAVDEGTQLTLVHERLEALIAAMPELADRFEAGWRMALDRLPSALEA